MDNQVAIMYSFNNYNRYNSYNSLTNFFNYIYTLKEINLPPLGLTFLSILIKHGWFFSIKAVAYFCTISNESSVQESKNIDISNVPSSTFWFNIDNRHSSSHFPALYTGRITDCDVEQTIIGKILYYFFTLDFQLGLG